MSSNALLNDPHDAKWRQYTVNVLQREKIKIKQVINITWLLMLEVKFSEPKSENVHVTSTESRYS